MEKGKVGVGGFYFPRVYTKNETGVLNALDRGDIDYADLTSWSFADEFLCFILQYGLLQYVDSTYPNPRVKNEVPVWFLVTCQFLLRIYQTGKYEHLDYLLHAGSILTKLGFNVGTSPIGFNSKNKYERKTAVCQDTVRKFFKDTKSEEIRLWHNTQMQAWFRKMRCFDAKGIFILDESKLVVPSNSNYEGAVKMPVDEHGQIYKNLDKISSEQRRGLLYHPCYALSALLHIDTTKDAFHVAGYELGPGNEDELVQAERLLPQFCKNNPTIMKELIVDRGYISIDLMEKMKIDHGVDMLIPLRKNMDAYFDAVAIAKSDNKWRMLDEVRDYDDKVIAQTFGANVASFVPPEKSKVDQFATVGKEVAINPDTGETTEKFFVLSSTKKYIDPGVALLRYRLRTQIEERFKQLKHSWFISEFSSPHKSLIESHVCFTLFTYSLLQLYLQRNDLKDKTRQTMQKLRRSEKVGKDAVLIYSGDEYSTIALDEYVLKTLGLDGDAKQKIRSLMERQIGARQKREN